MAEVIPAVTPTGPLPLQVRMLVDLIAASATFQARCDAANKAAAYRFIHYPYLRAGGLWEIHGPVAVVGSVNFGITRKAVDFFLVQNTSLGLVLSDDDRYPDDPQSSETDFENFSGGVLTDITAYDPAGGLIIQSINLLESKKSGIENATPDQRNVYWQAIFEVRTGLGNG